MDLGRLKFLRFLVPPAILAVFWSILGTITGLWKLGLRPDFQDVNNLGIVIPGVIYYALPLRQWANKPYFDDVSENLRSGLIRVSGVADRPEILTWKALRGVFFSLVDNDTSLTTKAKLAYWNGLFWTSAADVRAISVLFAALAAVSSLLVGERGWVAFGIFAALFVFSIPLSSLLTNHHKRIGNEQIEIIEHNHQQDLRAKLEKIIERASR